MEQSGHLFESLSPRADVVAGLFSVFSAAWPSKHTDSDILVFVLPRESISFTHVKMANISAYIVACKIRLSFRLGLVVKS